MTNSVYQGGCYLQRLKAVVVTPSENSIIALLFIRNISSFLIEFRHFALCFSAHQK